MASSDGPIDPAAAKELGSVLTGTEARQLADRLADGDTLTSALRVVAGSSRPRIRTLLEGGSTRSRIAVLRAIEGARSTPTSVTSLWTMPGYLVRGAPLTSSLPHLVDGARSAVTCSTFNFQRSSGLWDALHRAARRPELAVTVYLDSLAAGQARSAGHKQGRSAGTPTAAEVARHLEPARVLRTKHFNGVAVRNHAKFLAIDHRFLLVTSANLSWSAEHRNVELGVLVDDRNLTEAVERELLDVEDLLYIQVHHS